MRKLIFAINCTPDGFCNHTDADVNETMYAHFNALFRNAGTVLFGRVVYQMMAEYWPSIAKTKNDTPGAVEFAELIDDVEKIVFSRTLKGSDWRKSTIINELTKDFIVSLKQKPGRDILSGSPGISSQLAQWGLIDEYHFVIHPFISGNGKRLFETIKLDKPFRLELISTETFEPGVTILKYKTKN